ncbi:hypothetical protein [Halopiger thermotolerans]
MSEAELEPENRHSERRIDLLETEYEQTGEEIRYRDRILHNSYYLLVIIFGVFAGNVLNQWGNSAIAVAALSFSAGIAFLFLAIVIEVYFRRRSSAMVRRDEVERAIRDDFPSSFELQKGLYRGFFEAGESDPREKQGLIENRGPNTVASIVNLGSGAWIGLAVYYLLDYSVNWGIASSVGAGVTICILWSVIVIYLQTRGRTGHYEGTYF